FLLLIISLNPLTTLFPYTTLFRSLFHHGGSFPGDAALCLADAARAAAAGEAECRAGAGFPAQSLPDRHDLLVFGGPHGYLLPGRDRKSTRLNSSHVKISYAVLCLQ